MKASRILGGNASGLLNLLGNTDSQSRPTPLSFQRLIIDPQVQLRSLSFIPPPRWAAELSRRLSAVFPDVEQKHRSRFMQSFIHSSFTVPEGVSSTMAPLIQLGESIISREVVHWIVSNFEHLRSAEMNSLASTIMSDASLSGVLRDAWGLENMILTDGAVDLFTRGKTLSADGLARWISRLGSSGSPLVPDPYCAQCVKAVHGAILLEHGAYRASQFCRVHTIPSLR